MSKHTKGPWFVSNTLKHTAYGAGQREGEFERVFACQSYGKKRGEPEANAARIVACVNACEGLTDPSVVPDLLAFVRDVAVENIDGFSDEEQDAFDERIRALLARAEGRK